MSITQTQESQDGAGPDAPEDPPEATTTTSPRGKATKTAFKVYADSDILTVLVAWRSEQPAESDAWPLGDWIPERLGDDDLICLGSYEATSRDDAVERLIADAKPSDRVRLVQLTYAAHIDMWFPVLSVASGYVKDVPAVWEINPVSRIGGR
jgi:hypothetical protein